MTTDFASDSTITCSDFANLVDALLLYAGPTPMEQEAHELPSLAFDALDGLDPEDPNAVEDAMNYLREQGIECTRQEVQEFLRKLKERLLRKLQDGDW